MNKCKVCESAEWLEVKRSGSVYCVKCRNCLAEGPTRGSRDDAISIWAAMNPELQWDEPIAEIKTAPPLTEPEKLEPHQLLARIQSLVADRVSLQVRALAMKVSDANYGEEDYMDVAIQINEVAAKLRELSHA